MLIALVLIALVLIALVLIIKWVKHSSRIVFRALCLKISTSWEKYHRHVCSVCRFFHLCLGWVSAVSQMFQRWVGHVLALGWSKSTRKAISLTKSELKMQLGIIFTKSQVGTACDLSSPPDWIQHHPQTWVQRCKMRQACQARLCYFFTQAVLSFGPIF